ncbi:MAG: hypothetical protein HQK61_03940 [Desulfamplus sp.]|nr:hypothetical protein [Desulfamplus sp.]
MKPGIYVLIITLFILCCSHANAQEMSIQEELLQRQEDAARELQENQRGRSDELKQIQSERAEELREYQENAIENMNQVRKNRRMERQDDSVFDHRPVFKQKSKDY